jgi:hypothetical protein
MELVAPEEEVVSASFVAATAPVAVAAGTSVGASAGAGAGAVAAAGSSVAAGTAVERPSFPALGAAAVTVRREEAEEFFCGVLMLTGSPFFRSITGGCCGGPHSPYSFSPIHTTT